MNIFVRKFSRVLHRTRLSRLFGPVAKEYCRIATELEPQIRSSPRANIPAIIISKYAEDSNGQSNSALAQACVAFILDQVTGTSENSEIASAMRFFPMRDVVAVLSSRPDSALKQACYQELLTDAYTFDTADTESTRRYFKEQNVSLKDPEALLVTMLLDHQPQDQNGRNLEQLIQSVVTEYFPKGVNNKKILDRLSERDDTYEVNPEVAEAHRIKVLSGLEKLAATKIASGAPRSNPSVGALVAPAHSATQVRTGVHKQVTSL